MPLIDIWLIARVLQDLDSFFASGSWESLDLHPLVANAFQNAGLQRPSQAQVCLLDNQLQSFLHLKLTVFSAAFTAFSPGC